MSDYCGGIVPWDTVFNLLLALAIFCIVIGIGISIIERVKEEAATCGDNCTALTTIPLEARE